MLSKFFLLLCLHALLQCNVSALNTITQDVTVNLVSETLSSRHRARRDATPSPVMPEKLIFQMTLQGKSVVLRLAKSSLLPVVTDDVETTLQANKVPEDSAVYTDAAHRSSFVVHRNNGRYSLKGTLSVSDASWSLEPLQQEAAVTKSQNHRAIRRLEAPAIHYGNDAILDKLERPELIHSKKLYRHPGHRQRRAVTRHVIEVAFIVDYADYQKWVALYGDTDALIRMRLWYTSVADALRALYESITDPDISITTSVTVLKILTTAAADTFIANITTNGQFDAGTGLSVLASWAQLQADIPLSDHYMLFTGRDVIGVSGIALLARTCTSFGVSIVENDFSGLTAQVAAHELGHSISSDHDSQTGGVCSDTDQYIMAAISAVNVELGNEGKPWKFSNCSINSFKTYLTSKTCTRPEYTSTVDVLPAPQVGQRAGEVLSKDDQCRLALNYPQSSYYAGSAADQAKLCSGMWCFSPLGNGIITLVRPLAYTSCGTNMICLQGFCVPFQQVTTTVSTTTTTPTTTTSTTTSSTTTTSTTTKPTTTSTTTTSTTTKPTTTSTTTTSTTTKPTTTSSTSTTTTSTTTKPTTTSTTTTSTTTKPTTTSSTTSTTTTSTTTKPTTTSTTTTSTTTKPTTTSSTTSTTTTSTTTKPTTTSTTTTSTTSKPTMTSSTTTTTTQPTTTSMKLPLTEADCYLDPYYSAGTRLAECLLYIWQHLPSS
ncbi:GPI-anchored protein PB15E9.01c [Biomphalaria glabrata]|nr:putative GPI-anchored protein PB15E9.01c [Biomphalaria glabrata]